jgi:peroxiredoxin
MQLGRLQGNWKRIVAAGGTVLAVSVDEADKSKELAQLFGLAFPLLQDTDESVIKRWGVEEDDTPIPSVFVVDAKGVVVWRSIGFAPFEAGVVAAMEELGKE